jgi:hypothetical protein
VLLVADEVVLQVDGALGNVLPMELGPLKDGKLGK